MTYDESNRVFSAAETGRSYRGHCVANCKPLLLLTLLVLSGALLQAQRAEVHGGNVYYTDAQGRKKQVTRSGVDHDAALSPDGKAIVFVRDTIEPARFEEPANDHPTQRQIWRASTEGAGGATLVFSQPVILKDWSEYVSFSAPRLSLDNRSVYFLIPQYVTEGGLIRLDLKTKQTLLLTSALTFWVAGPGSFEGDLVVQKRKPLDGGFTRYYWLVTPDGRELGLVGESERDVREFLASPRRALREQ
jgi:hypothetical protein